MEKREPFIRMVNIEKRFGVIKALEDVNVDIYEKEVIGLLGDNGAGKSTLIKILSGIHTPEEGEVYFQGRKVSITSPLVARKLGIETVHQSSSLVDTISIARNFFLGREPVKKIGPFSFLDKEEMEEMSREAIKGIGIKVRSPREFVSILSGGERQAIAIGRAVYFGAKVLILDEPLRALSVKEQRTVLNHIRDVRESGSTIIFITHNIHHVYPVADRFVLMDNGVKIGELKKSEATEEEISEMIATGQML